MKRTKVKYEFTQYTAGLIEIACRIAEKENSKKFVMQPEEALIAVLEDYIEIKHNEGKR